MKGIKLPQKCSQARHLIEQPISIGSGIIS